VKILSAPKHKFYLGGNYRIGKFTFDLSGQYIGNLYTEIDTEATSSYFVLKATVDYRVANWLNVYVNGDNLLDQQYEINFGYPMPGIMVLGGIRINYEGK
jgi:iron complex outermembrane receptor protein